MRALIPKTLKISALPPITVANLPTSSFRSMSSQQGGRMFQLKLDPLTGNSEWVVIEEDEAPDIPPRPLLATTSYLDMLNDTRRNRAYREAIDKTVTKPCHVLDIGAGTGLLSMMAARAMDSDKSTEYSSSKGIVTACESYLPMVKLMRKVLRLNGMERKVRLINKRSDELEVGVDISSKADILVSEILDSELLGEGLIPTLQHAHDNLLVENPLTVPYRATTYAQLVESKYLWKLNDLYNNEAEVSDDIRLIPTTKESVLCVKPQQFAMYCGAIKDEITLLSEPFKVFEFDFWRRPESRGESKVQIKVTNDGTVHAVLSWWVLQLDSAGTIFYSTAPQWITCPSSMELHSSSRTVKEAPTGDWCDHWKQCVYFIPGKGLQVSKDGEVHLRAIHTDTNILYELESQAQEKDIKQNDSTKADPLILSPERIAIYGDRKWRSSILEAVKRALQEKESPLCVVADDSVFLTVAVARFSKKAHVISLFPGLREKGAKYLQAVAVENGFLKDQIEVPEKRKKNLSMDDTRRKKVDILFGEPFYYGNDNMLPWQNLRFWNERTMLDPILSSDALIMPCKGILKACAMYLPDLWRSRCSLGDIEGFDHSSVNTTLGACGELRNLCLPFFVWQCGEHKGISETFTVMEFDFLKPISPCSGKVKVEFTSSGICHGFVLWIDWVMDEGNSIMIPTGPDQRHWKQGVKLLTNPVIVGTHGSTLGKGSVEVEAHFDPVSGELSVHHAFK